jgi:hypothetical protein
MEKDIIVGQYPLPNDAAQEVSDLIANLCERYEFLNGETAAFWAVSCVLAQHLGEGKK